MLTEADLRATEALTAVQPAWTGLRTAADALQLQPHTLSALRTTCRPAACACQADTELRRRRMRIRRLGE